IRIFLRDFPYFHEAFLNLKIRTKGLNGNNAGKIPSMHRCQILQEKNDYFAAMILCFVKWISLSVAALFLFHKSAWSQMDEKKIPGEYDLQGVMEVGSGFVFHPDHTFEFFFSYGSVDRQGIGTWKLESSNIILNSEPWPGSDFKMVKHQHSRRK